MIVERKAPSSATAMDDPLQQFVGSLFAEPGETTAMDLPSSTGPGPLSLTDAPVERAGDQVGRYQLVEPLGAGGFGTVWRAEQARPVRREVALKIIKVGMDTREVVARFEAERQVLAVLDHPHIAKVFDAGATITGRPFFVMELVRGVPITRYSAERGLTLAQRLELFAEVCRAVQHAHQKGIIHRDLKPSNLLVTEMDGKPVPKVIDFGIAKAAGDERLTDNTLTCAGTRIGTPAYMSPEQDGASLDIDTRTDIYSLGVVLYELLTGHLPHVAGPNGKVDRSRDPVRPSKLSPAAKGDLDWIAMKALEQDRARRYDSAAALADDVAAFLAHEPVKARPPTTGYLLRRFTQRNKLAVGAAAAIVLVLVAGVAVSTWMYFQQRRALIQSQQVSAFLTHVLEEAGPSKALGRDGTMLRDIMDKTAERIGTELAGQPAVEVELRGVLCDTYYRMSELPRALAQADEVLRLRRLHALGDDVAMAVALMDRGRILESMGRNQEAIEVMEPALAIRQRVFGPGHELTARIHGHLAWCLMRVGRAEEAEKSARLAMDAFRTAPDPYLMSSAPAALGMILHRTHRDEESAQIGYEYLEAMKKRFGPEHPQLIGILDNLGYQLTALKRPDEAEPLLLEAVRLEEKFFPGHKPLHPHIYDSLLAIAAQRKDWEQQLRYARRHLATVKRPAEPDARDVRAAAAQLARVLMDNAERCANEASKLKARPAQAAAAARATAFLDELRNTDDFKADVKSSAGWIDCLRGMVLRADPAKRDEATALLTRGLEALKKKAKPAAQDAQRIQKAEALLRKGSI